MLDTHAMYVKQGYEGIILRDQFEKYSFGNRTTGIIKYKVPESEEFVVDSFEISKRGEGTPWCMYVGLDGKPGLFKAPVATTIERRKFYAQNPEKFIGKHLTVDFEKLSKYGKPTKPIGKAFREVDLDGNPKT
jgi:DNA ligase-1